MQQRQPEPVLDELYRELILDHYKHPRHRTQLEHADAVAEGYNPVCGDEGEIPPDFDADRVARIGIIGRGCSISQASGSMMSELLQGRPIAEIPRLTDEFQPTT